MRKKSKIIYLILFIIVLFISAVSIFLFENKNSKVEIAKNQTNIADSNSIIAVDETTDTNNEIIENVIDSTTTEPSIELENIEQESSQEKVQPKTQTTTNNQTQSQPKPVQEKKTVSGTIQKQETVVTNTKEETSKTETSTPVETTSKQENKQTNTNNDAKNDTTTKEETTSTEPVDTIKRISEDELQAEKAKYLNDIQTIKPGLKYKEVKRGQVFWPYRTTEIEIAVGGVSFGTIYYYVDVFVEGNQEKFKYYIDWTGE